MSNNRIYAGHPNGQVWPVEIFRADSTPTQVSHGDRFAAVVGPFSTIRGARYFQRYGRSNPHVQTVADAERLARQYPELVKA